MPPSFSVLASRAIVPIPSGTLTFSCFDVQKIHSFLSVSFGVIVPRHSCPLALSVLSLWVRIYPRFSHFVTLCLLPIHHCSSRFPFSVLRTMSIEFTIHISVMLLSTLHLSFSCSSHRVASFRHSLFCSSEWFDRYSSLIWSSESLLETS